MKNEPDKGGGRHHISSIAHHFLGSTADAQRGPVRILVAGWPDDSCSARAGAAIAGLWRSSGGATFSGRDASTAVDILEDRQVCRSVVSCLGDSGLAADAKSSEPGLVLGHFGFPVAAELEACETVVASGGGLLLVPGRWPTLVWALAASQPPCRLGATYAARVGKLAGSDHLSVLLIHTAGEKTNQQASLVMECEGLYRAVATAMDMTWHVLALEVGPAGQVRSSGASDLMVEIKRAALLV